MTATPFEPRMSAEDIERFLADQFPHALELAARVTLIAEGVVEVTLPYDPRQLRPGGTLSGPTLMTLADTAMYFLLLSHLGPVALAVTTSLHIDFLRRPEPRDVVARAELMKLGRTLAVGHVVLRSVGDPRPIAQANVTYALPPKA